MIRGKVELEINGSYLMYKELKNNRFISRIKNTYSLTHEVNGNIFDDVRVNLKNKCVWITIGGEEIYVKIMTLPKMKDNKLHFIIENELKYRFNNIDNIMFTYDILEDLGTSIKVVVFCLNWNRLNLIKECTERGAKIQGIYPVQFYILNNYRAQIKEKLFYMIFIYKKDLYILVCYKGKIIINSIVKAFTVERFFDEFESVKSKYNMLDFEEEPRNIFFANFHYEDIIRKLGKQYNCNILDNYTHESTGAE